VLNFFNAILTGIITRKREMAVLQSIGMTGKQLKTMLVCEGLLYALSSVLLSLVLAVVLGPLAFSALQSMFWFFTYRFTLAPILAVAPVFALLGILHFAYKKKTQKAPSPIGMILLSAVLGAVLWSI